MNIVLAKNSGFCYGVKRAVDMALRTQKDYKRNIYTLGPLIHNKDVVDFLKHNNVFPIELKEIDRLNKGDVIIIRSHGISLETLNILKRKKFNIIDATCTYVSSIQKKVKEYYDLGYSILIIGDKTHPEVIGINGWCENDAIISKDGENIEKLPPKICVVSQTTEKEEHWNKVLNIVIKQCKEIVAFNTICSATSIRQKAAESLSKEVQAMVILGGKNSSNTTKLYEICKKNCQNTIHVENAGELPEYIYTNKISSIGVTAGASTPDWIVREAIYKMSNNEKSELSEQLEFMNNNDIQISIGQIIEGEVTAINSNEKEAFINIGYKSDAVLPVSEITKEENANISDYIKNGDKVRGKIISIGSENSAPILSVIELIRESSYEELKEAFNNKKVITVRIKEAVNGGLLATYNNILRVFIPASHIELYHVDNLQTYVNQIVEVNIIEFSISRNNTKIVASRRELLKEEQLKMEEKAWESISKDTIVTGEIKRLTDFGAFIDVNGIDGLLHVSEISWGRVNKPSDVLKIGDKIKVYIINVDKENKKLSLSIKKLTEDPWVDVDVKYPMGTIVLGKVVRFASFGAFIQLEPGIDGLVHISQISHKRIERVEEVLAIGETIKAKILEVDKENKKIALSIKEVNDI
ncbi:bifunctional 4-hydroxy-3-methylbut-2-enyl diphosphate reductase/30S ribosomal protein S1 [Clostridium rectalis]|uniref:bifunctional 4-hydroxy-3-methylbut-2-enyl diphosphate reductase/30S ribosomal protein S1 n=1 Tax=Clostridium rectalis TaxID=2040295 RepID=UPI000F634F49|nr:bifunctional 4-hydroxy-3-methylbut-2-enyl diphosphate reductase/30S ribosomal protein S1 [Clostridium rectalis]